MRAIITMMLVLFCGMAFSQTYTFQRNDFRLEILRGTQIRSSMLLEDVRWVERNAGEAISVFDGVHSFTVNDEQIGNYASNQIDSLIIDLEAWRLLAITRVSGDTLFIGNDTLITGAGGLMDSLYNSGTSAWISDGDTIQGYVTAEVDGSITNELDSIYDANQSVWLLNGDTIQAIAAGGGFTDTMTVEAITLVQDSVNLPYATADFLFGSPSMDDDGDANHDARMYFDKSQGAFRAGRADGTEWDSPGSYSSALGWNNQVTGLYGFAAGRGNTVSQSYSVALGWNNTVSDLYAVAMGTSNTASNQNTIAMGRGNTASALGAIAMGTRDPTNNTSSGQNSFTQGYICTATGNYSRAMGLNTDASGYASSAFGRLVKARSYGEFSVGLYPTDYTADNATAFDADDRIFNIGIGSAGGADAFTIIKNGKVGIGIDNFEAADDGAQILHINGSMKVMQVDTLPLGDDTLTTANHYVIKVNANASSNDTIFLPDLTVGTDEGTYFLIKDGTFNAATNPFVVTGIGDNIDNAGSYAINTDGGKLGVVWYNNIYYIKEN